MKKIYTNLVLTLIAIATSFIYIMLYDVKLEKLKMIKETLELSTSLPIDSEDTSIQYYLKNIVSYFPFGSLNEAKTISNLSYYYEDLNVNKMDSYDNMIYNALNHYFFVKDNLVNTSEYLIANFVSILVSIVTLVIIYKLLNKINNIILRKICKVILCTLFLANFIVMTNITVYETQIKNKLEEIFKLQYK
ncbi:hypothetical protein [Empedobacter falsenii]